jgi:(2R)-3-sulfolactate dehydrogenase (NADP+)
VQMRNEDVLSRLRALGFAEREARTLADHFLDAEARGKSGHGLARIAWLERQEIDPVAEPERLYAEEGFQRWDGRGALGYLTLAEICVAQIDSPPAHARAIVVSNCFPTGMLGHYTRKLADAGLVAVLTATSPARLAHPDGGPPLAGTNPVSIAVPSAAARPIVVDVSMGQVTYGDVIAGLASEDELVPFGGDRAHKAFALALGLQLLVDSLAGDGYGAVMLVAQPEADPVPALRRLAGGARLPGDAPTKA